jgi:hypothetical protein
MKRKFRQPFRSGGPKSKSLQFVIPSYIVKQHGIDESTGFIVEHDDRRIILSYANVEKRNHPTVGFGVENSSQHAGSSI